MKFGLKTSTFVVSFAIAGLLLSACATAAPAAPAATAVPAATTAPVTTEAPATEVAAVPTEAATVASTEAMTATEAMTPTEAMTATEAMTMTEGVSTTAEAPAATTGGPVTLKIVESESQASYEVDETFLEGNKLATAIGLTPKVNGEIMLNTADPSQSKVGTITVDISLLKSEGHPNGNGSARRDNALKDRWLESSKYPLVEFTPTTLEGLPTTYTPGQELTFKMIGDMKIRDTSKPVTWDVVANYDGTTLTGTATTAIKMSDFSFEAPNIAGMLRAEDDAKLTLQFVAKP